MHGTKGAVFYVLSKTLDLAFSPLFAALALGALSALAIRRGRRTLSVRLGVIAWLLAYLPATGGAAAFLMSVVEDFDGPRARPDVRYDAVILLGGFAGRNRHGELELSEAADRLLAALRLLRSGQAARVILAGGGSGGSGGEAESDIAAALLREAGIADERMVLDRKSRNTRENAVETKALADAHGLAKLVLVTSAFHMQRALECMRAVGLHPDAHAVDHPHPMIQGPFDLLAPRSDNLRLSELALRELAGRLVYRLRGFSVRE